MCILFININLKGCIFIFLIIIQYYSKYNDFIKNSFTKSNNNSNIDLNNSNLNESKIINELKEELKNIK